MYITTLPWKYIWVWCTVHTNEDYGLWNMCSWTCCHVKSWEIWSKHVSGIFTMNFLLLIWWDRLLLLPFDSVGRIHTAILLRQWIWKRWGYLFICHARSRASLLIPRRGKWESCLYEWRRCRLIPIKSCSGAQQQIEKMTWTTIKI